MLTVRNISIYRPGSKQIEEPLLRDLNFDIRAGELACILGRNGAGKTTLIKTIAGLLPVQKGQVAVEGQSITALKARERSKRISVVLTEQHAMSWHTAKDLVAHGRTPHTDWLDKLSSRDHQQISCALEYVHADSIRDRLFGTLSDGEKQRIYIARALAQDTPIVLLDEPMSYLDIVARSEIIHLLKELATTLNKAILMSSHDLHLVMQAVDKCILIDEGRCTAVSEPKALIQSGALESAFPGITLPSQNSFK